MIDSGGLGGIPPEEVSWHSNLDGELGRGTELQRALSAGRHEITVRAPDGLGGMLSERAIIVVGGKQVAAKAPNRAVRMRKLSASRKSPGAARAVQQDEP